MRENQFGMNRAENISLVKDRKTPWDIIVIGGGATGVGCALDAATRGLDVLLLEQHDFGKGTSSRSTKLIHGGVRYLAQGNIALVREALRERGLLMKNAPHVVHKQTFIVPCYSHWQKLFYGTGLKIYDLLSGNYSLGKSRVLSKSETLDHVKNIKPTGLRGGVLYYDGQFDDTRLLIDLAVAADKYGAALLNYSPVTALTKTADGKIDGVEFEDSETGETIFARSKTVINATGAFSDAVRTMSDATSPKMLTHSQGIHLVFDRKFLPGDDAVMIPKTSDGRVLFCIPWHGHTLVGTTDTPIETAELEPNAFEAEIDFVLETAGAYLLEKPGRGDILSVFAGVRPLIRSSHTARTASLSRSHELAVDAGGLITITGGKWTTYRHMAEETIDLAVKRMNLSERNCITECLKIAGPDSTPDGELLHPGLPYFRSDVVRAVRNEMARTVEDVLARRTRALFLNAKAAIELASEIAAIMAVELNKNNDWAAEQVARFEQVADNYLVSSNQ